MKRSKALPQLLCLGVLAIILAPTLSKQFNPPLKHFVRDDRIYNYDYQSDSDVRDISNLDDYEDPELSFTTRVEQLNLRNPKISHARNRQLVEQNNEQKGEEGLNKNLEQNKSYPKTYDFLSQFKSSGKKQLHGYVDDVLDDFLNERDSSGYCDLCKARESAIPLAKAYASGHGDMDPILAAIDKLEGKLHLQVDYYIEGITADLLAGILDGLEQDCADGVGPCLTPFEHTQLTESRDKMKSLMSLYATTVKAALTENFDCDKELSLDDLKKMNYNDVADYGKGQIGDISKKGRKSLHGLLDDLLDDLLGGLDNEQPRQYRDFESFKTSGRTQMHSFISEQLNNAVGSLDKEGFQELCKSREQAESLAAAYSPDSDPMAALQKALDKLEFKVHVGVDFYVEGITPDLIDFLMELNPDVQPGDFETQLKEELRAVTRNYARDLQKALTSNHECEQLTAELFDSSTKVFEEGRIEFEKAVEHTINQKLISFYQLQIRYWNQDHWSVLTNFSMTSFSDFNFSDSQWSDEFLTYYDEFEQLLEAPKRINAEGKRNENKIFEAVNSTSTTANNNNNINNNKDVNNNNNQGGNLGYDPDDSDIVSNSTLDAMGGSDGLLDDFLDDFLGDLLGGLFYETDKTKDEELTRNDDKTKEYTEVHYSNWGDEISDSLAEAIFGFFLIFFTIPCLWFNERRSVQTGRIIEDGYKACYETDSINVDDDLNNELVHVCAKAICNKTIHDEDFGVTAENCAKLRRYVEVFQVQELSETKTKKDQIGGGKTTTTTYRYDTQWSSEKVDSSRFKDSQRRDANNKVNFFTQSKTVTTDQVQLGQYKLNRGQIDRLNNFVDVDLNRNIISSFSKKTRDTISKLGWGNINQYVESNYIYIRQSHSQEPQVGDIRLSFRKVPCDWTTVVAQQSHDTFEPYNIARRQFRVKSDAESAKLLDEEERAGCCESINSSVDDCCWNFCYCLKCAEALMKTPDTIDWIYTRQMTKKETFNSEIETNRMWTVLARFGGILGLALGIYLIFSPLLAILSIVKIFSDIVGFAIGLVAFLVALAVGFVVIALSWVFYRPLVGLTLLAISGAIWGLIYYYQSVGA